MTAYDEYMQRHFWRFGAMGALIQLLIELENYPTEYKKKFRAEWLNSALKHYEDDGKDFAKAYDKDFPREEKGDSQSG